MARVVLSNKREDSADIRSLDGSEANVRLSSVSAKARGGGRFSYHDPMWHFVCGLRTEDRRSTATKDPLQDSTDEGTSNCCVFFGVRWMPTKRKFRGIPNKRERTLVMSGLWTAKRLRVWSTPVDTSCFSSLFARAH